jgi:hypothetical protein
MIGIGAAKKVAAKKSDMMAGLVIDVHLLPDK